MRINLELLNRDVDYSSITNPMFELDEEEDEPELPSAWREEDEAEDEAPHARTAAVERSAARAAALAANATAAAAGAPRAQPAQQRAEGRRTVRRQPLPRKKYIKRVVAKTEFSARCTPATKKIS